MFLQKGLFSDHDFAIWLLLAVLQGDLPVGANNNLILIGIEHR